jgi:concanavalin A-like lectin/glucanase superfamily protein/Big-like domain-containing protein
MRSSRWILFVLLVWLASSVWPQAQIDTSILDASRRIDWRQAGVPGGIPNRTTICATLNPGATATQINNAIASCNNGVVYLNAGTYNLSGGITFNGSDDVTLRGAGANRTILRFTTPDSCGGVQANVCIQGAAIGSSPPAANIHNWTAGFAKSSTLITVDSATGITVGSVLVLDQLDDPSDTGGVYISCAAGASLETCPSTRTNRSQQQMVSVVSVSGNQVTISPGLHMPNWRSARQPQVWWWGDSAEMNGIEDLTLDHTNGTETSGIGFRNAHGAWVKNVTSLNSNRNHVWLYRSARIEVRNSYFYGTKNAATLSYGVESFMTSDSLVINNIFQHVSRPIMMGPAAGSVYAYNFMTDMYYTNPATWLNGSINGSHDSGTGMNLFEGNVGTAFLMDLYHGTGALPTLFRNRLTGQEPGKTQNTSVINIWGFNRLANVVGNVLGTSGYHTKYEDSRVSPGTAGSPDRSIYLLGYTGVNEGTSLGYDSLVATMLLRWGNFDYATGQTRWNALEIPAGNAVPSTQTLPASLFLSARPSWWGTMPWPAIGPDVTGGQDPAGHAHRIPAQLCYDNSARNGDGTLVFNPAQCYTSSPPDTTPPTVSITAPSNGATVSGAVTLGATASDNVGVVSVQFRLDGANLGTELTTAPFTAPWNTIGSANGSHSLTAVARDTSGNTGTSTAVAITVNNAPDTAPPSTPSNVAATAVSFSQINVTWNASTDNVGVAGYGVLRCQGAACSPVQLTTVTVNSYSDTGVSPSSSYTYAVSAYDAANNVSGTSATVAATTPALPSPTLSLVAAYGFSEGSGITTMDVSSNNNTATLSAAAWTSSGRFGSGLTFNGTSSVVEAADINPLTAQADATFMAWVFLNSAPTEVASVFNKWSQTVDDEFMFGISPNRTLYFAWQTTGGSSWGGVSYDEATGIGQIPLTTWAHIAVVRRGADLLFYINGSLDATLGSAMDTSPFRNGITTLRIGGQGRGSRNRFFNGVLDEARIYDRALSQAEIQSSMTFTIARSSSVPAPATNVRVTR